MKKIQISILSLAFLSMVVVATPVLAISTTVGGTASTTRVAKAAATLQTRIQTGEARATQEIDRRVTVLNNLTAKTSEATRITSDEKTSISNTISQQINSLSQLKTKILADTDITTLKADIKSITDSYRIFMLVVPQINVIRTTDSMAETSQVFGALYSKLQARIALASSAGNDVSSINALMSDLTAKITDAEAKAQASVAAVISLVPDQGNSATIAANKAAFTLARVDIKTAQADFKTARSDAGQIVKALEAMKKTASTTASTTAQ